MKEVARTTDGGGAADGGRGAGDRWRWGAQVAALLALVWMALDGLGNLLPGALFVLAGAGLGAWLVPGDVYRWRPLRLLAFAAWFLWASWRGGLDVAWRAMAPAMPVAPLLHRHPLQLPPGLPRTVFVAVLSLLPGTLSVALEDDDSVLLVHALVPASIAGVADLERRVAWLFSLPWLERGR